MEVFEALRAVRCGGTYVHPLLVGRLMEFRTGFQPAFRVLTPREQEVLEGVCQGRTYALLGQELGLAETTIKTYVASLFRKYSVANRSELVFKVMSERMR